MFSGLSNYIAGVKGDFAIYRTGDNYAYFDSSIALASGLKNVKRLMRIVEKVVEFAGYEMEEKGFLVIHFDVDKANNCLMKINKL